jgi:hypothetical protein
MFLTMVKATDGAGFHTDRADRRVVNVAGGKVFVAKAMVTARLHGEMVAAQRGVTEIAMAHALLAARFAALRTGDGIGGELSTAGALVKTLQTIGFAAVVTLVEAGADLPPTFTTGDQAVDAEALAGSGTDAKLRAVLLATWATNGTISTNERMRTAGICYCIGAQVAATLASATFSAFTLAGEADTIATNGAAFDMFSTGAFATGPTGCATSFTIGLATHRTSDHATVGAEDFETRPTLFDAIVTADVPVAVEGDYFTLTVAGVAGGALEAPCVAVAGDMDGGLALAIA